MDSYLAGCGWQRVGTYYEALLVWTTSVTSKMWRWANVRHCERAMGEAMIGPFSSNPTKNFDTWPLRLIERQSLVSKILRSPLEILWKSFSLVFFAEWGDRSMLATIALGAAQSPWGVACGAIAGHLFATSLAILGGAFLARYISEKLVGYIGGLLFLIFAAATLFGVF